MRKLSYEIFDRQGNKVKEVKTYIELEQERDKGNFYKCKLTDIIERQVYEIYKGKELIKIVTTNKARAQAKKEGYTIKTIIRAF